MRLITSNLDKEIKKIFKNADETWISVALMTKKGLDLIINKNKKNNFLIGTGLPTEPSALKSVLKLQNKGGGDVAIFPTSTFHPKVYLAKKAKHYLGILGSSNCTNGGLKTNIEANCLITNQSQLKQLQKWFEVNIYNGYALTKEYIDKYEKLYKKRKQKQAAIEDLTDTFIDKVEDQNDFTLTRQKQLVSRIKTWKKTKEFKEISKRQRQIIKNYRANLDYPNFTKIELSPFISKYELGHTHGLNAPIIKGHKKKFRNMVNYLKVDSIPILTRFNEAYNGKFSIESVSRAIITKILIVIFPNKYPVWNSKSYAALEKYGFSFPKTTNNGIKYKAFSDAIDFVSKKTGIKDRAVIDYFLFFKCN